MNESIFLLNAIGLRLVVVSAGPNFGAELWWPKPFIDPPPPAPPMAAGRLPVLPARADLGRSGAWGQADLRLGGGA